MKITLKDAVRKYRAAKAAYEDLRQASDRAWEGYHPSDAPESAWVASTRTSTARWRMTDAGESVIDAALAEVPE